MPSQFILNFVYNVCEHMRASVASYGQIVWLLQFDGALLNALCYTASCDVYSFTSEQIFKATL